MSEYRIFGDIETAITGTIDPNADIFTGLTLTSTTGTKTIILQIWSGNNRTTHYTDSIEYQQAIAPTIIFTGDTPAQGLFTGNTITGQAEITATALDTFSRERQGISYPIYDSGLRLMLNMDNVALGESDGGFVKDFSQYQNNATPQNGAITAEARWNR